MAKGKLKKSSESKAAAKVRAVLDIGPDVDVEISTPQFERPAGDPPPTSPPPPNVYAWNALRAMSDQQLQEMGLRRWGRPEAEDLTAELSGCRRADLTGLPMLWLFPAEWYDHIPDGYEIVDIFYNIEPFKRGKTDNDMRFGCLSYGILVRDAS